MQISDEIRRLQKKWAMGNAPGWPKRLEWLEVAGMRGWSGQRIRFEFPIVALVGENGSGKSTIIQAAACAYRNEVRTWFPSEFFPDTAWDDLRDVSIRYGYLQGKANHERSLRKPTTRWLGQPERLERGVKYIDLNRIQPVGARVGYARIAKNRHEEKSATQFDAEQTTRLSFIMNEEYEAARMALSTIDDARRVPVIVQKGIQYSGFHQGSGQITLAELIQSNIQKYELIVIDEVESSLHPRAQRRLIRDLATLCREHEIQIVLTTHSPCILEELPLEARICILKTAKGKEIFPGISPEFAMTKMDDDAHPECDVYVEDDRARVFVEELLARHGPDVFPRCEIVPFGAASVGYALGQMVSGKRFQRPTCVLLDGDSAPGEGCVLLPGNDAPERVVFATLKEAGWANVWARVARDTSLVADACHGAMTLPDHHDWVTFAAKQLRCGGEALWHAMCAEWAARTNLEEVAQVVDAIADTLPV
jgi:predicted ATPase